MVNFRQYRGNLLLPVLAVLCTAASVWGQGTISDELPVISSPREVARLVMARPKPDYPPVAKVNYLQGLVRVKITVTQQGKVTSAHVLEGNAILAVEALKATRRWIYRPLATSKGPSGFITTVRLKFSLGNSAGDLSPQRAEQDFLRQVRPPQTLAPPVAGPSQDVVRVRLLVNDEGQVVDRDCGPTSRPHFEATCESLLGWKFRPAFWGNLPIASYLDVNVPFDTPPLARTASLTGSR